MSKQIFSTFKVLILAVVLSIGLSYLYAWTAPTANPPLGNVSAPLNTSATAQTKAGALTVGAFTSAAATVTSLSAGAGTISTTGLLSGKEIIANKIMLVTGAGTGKVLTSDLSGNATWQSASVSVGVGQTWQRPTPRSFNTTYTNTTGKPIFVSISVWAYYGDSGVSIYVDGAERGRFFSPDVEGQGQLTAIVPNGSTYYITSLGPNNGGAVLQWSELR